MKFDNPIVESHELIIAAKLRTKKSHHARFSNVEVSNEIKNSLVIFFFFIDKKKVNFTELRID